jgi:uncharacterized protein
VTQITVYKCDAQGNVVWQYGGQMVDGGDSWVCLQAPFERPDMDMGYVVFRQGDLFTEWFYADRWYNVFRIEDVEDGRLKGWYCNVTRPAHLTQEAIYADDLALDVFVTPNGSIILLDEDEFDELELSADERIAALRAVESIRSAVSERAEPFSEIRLEAI